MACRNDLRSDHIRCSTDFEDEVAETWESFLEDSDANLWETHYDTAVPGDDGELIDEREFFEDGPGSTG